jgi:hypothetical protein
MDLGAVKEQIRATHEVVDKSAIIKPDPTTI